MIRPEVGKRYRTRDGREALIIQIRDALSVSGTVDGKLWRCIWWNNGRRISDDFDAGLDLIECIGKSDE